MIQKKKSVDDSLYTWSSFLQDVGVNIWVVCQSFLDLGWNLKNHLKFRVN